MFWLEEGVVTVLQPLHITREHEHETADSKPYLVTLEKHIRTRRVYIYVVFLQEMGESRNSRMLHRIKQKSYLIIVLEFAGSFQVIDEPQNFLVPLVRIVDACKFYDCGAMKSGLLMRLDFFVKSVVFPAKLELRTVRGSHPFIVEVNNIAVGAVVDYQRNNSAFAVRKLLRKLQNITDGGTSETVQALVIITNHTDILSISGEKEHKLLLNKVCVLILVYHDVRDFGAHFFKDV